MRKLTPRENRLKAHLISVVKTLGPRPIDCRTNTCDGCKFEISDALKTALYALRSEFGLKKKDI